MSFPATPADGACPWQFAVSVRPSRFAAADPAYAPYNIEVALDRIAPFAFGASVDGPVLYYDRQTQLEHNVAGRHGSGRSGVFAGRYVKGLGRTPAAANWAAADDVHHSSGHLSVASALRERLITKALVARGLEATIVPCEALLLGALSPDEAVAIGAGATSSDPAFAPADGHMVALSVKPADFARASNVVFALDHVDTTARALGTLFVDLERHLHEPGDARAACEGEPHAIVTALDDAFERGLRNFEAYARAGLSWLYVAGNHALDGRFVDLETPLFFGAPFLGVAIREYGGRRHRRLLGFDEFVFAREWRLLIAWLRARLELLSAPELLTDRPARLFVAALARELGARFSPEHLLHDDCALVARAASEACANHPAGARGHALLRELARFAFASAMYGRPGSLPDLGWRSLSFQPAAPTPFPQRYETPSFLHPTLSADGERFAADLLRLGAICDVAELLAQLTADDALEPALCGAPS